MIQWFFALDHVHYSQWLPIHLTDMIELETHNLNVYQHFDKGCWTNNKFSAMSLDPAHEQNIAIGKGVGDAVGWLSDAAVLRHWLVGWLVLGSITW